MEYGVQIKKGSYQVVTVEYDKKGISAVTPISGFLPIPEKCKNGARPNSKQIVSGTEYEKYF
jgi:hypothetical protein